jgi:hypothetical protein
VASHYEVVDFRPSLHLSTCSTTPSLPLDASTMSNQRPPTAVLEEHEKQWIFTESDLLKTPSILDGMDPAQERELRAKGVNFILQAGIMLKLPNTTLSTAAIFFNRFLMRHSLKSKGGTKALHHYVRLILSPRRLKI